MDYNNSIKVKYEIIYWLINKYICVLVLYLSSTYVRLLCGSGISFCCQSHLVPVFFRF